MESSQGVIGLPKVESIKSCARGFKTADHDICCTLIGLQLEQAHTDKFEGVHTGPPADTIAVSGQVELFDTCLLTIGQGDINKSDWLFGIGTGSRGGSRDAGDGNTERRSCASANALR